MNHKTAFHGSDIEKICSYYHLNRNSIVNFAANVNPLGLSPLVRKELAAHLELLTSYPDRNYTSLRNTIACCNDIPAEYILAGNGSSELISLLIEVKAPRHTLILGPTYSEYSRELSFSGSTQDYYHLRETEDFCIDTKDLCRTLAGGYDFLIICNPNNPTSSVISQTDLREIVSFCHKHDIFVMIDETYIEFVSDVPAVTAVPLTREFRNLMILRGISKFFAAPGLRMGYGITGNQEFLEKMRQKQIPWSLNSLGAFAGELMLKDTAYIEKTRSLVLQERKRIFRTLSQTADYKVYPANANFFLLKITKKNLTAFQVFETCIKNGLMIRDCSSFQCLEGEYIRFCIMMPDDNDRLINTLKQPHSLS